MKYVQWFEAINKSKVNVNEKVKVYSEMDNYWVSLIVKSSLEH